MKTNSNDADLCWTRGDSGRLDVSLQSPDATPYDLTGCTLFLTVKSRIADIDDAALLRIDVSTHDDAAGGKSHFDIPASSGNIAPGQYVYDVQMKTDSNEIYTLFSGLWIVRDDVTKRVVAV